MSFVGLARSADAEVLESQKAEPPQRHGELVVVFGTQGHQRVDAGRHEPPPDRALAALPELVVLVLFFLVASRGRRRRVSEV